MDFITTTLSINVTAEEKKRFNRLAEKENKAGKTKGQLFSAMLDNYIKTQKLISDVQAVK